LAVKSGSAPAVTASANKKSRHRAETVTASYAGYWRPFQAAGLVKQQALKVLCSIARPRARCARARLRKALVPNASGSSNHFFHRGGLPAALVQSSARYGEGGTNSNEASRRRSGGGGAGEKGFAELGIIADKLEKHLISKKPSEVGLNFEREGARMKLKSRDYTIIIDPGFREYTGMVVIGFPPQIARGSKRGLSTLEALTLMF
jgi:hypothetical protein